MSEVRSIVVDSSVIVKWLSSTKETHIEQSTIILEQMKQGVCSAHTPELAKYEVANALLKGKFLSVRQAKDVLEVLYRFPLKFVSISGEDAARVYAISYAEGITYYDATFIALAEKLSAPLITDNMKHQAGVKGVRVIPLGEYVSGEGEK